MVSEGVGRCSPLDNTVSSFFSPPFLLSPRSFSFLLFCSFSRKLLPRRGEERRQRCSCYAKRDRIAGRGRGGGRIIPADVGTQWRKLKRFSAGYTRRMLSAESIYPIWPRPSPPPSPIVPRVVSSIKPRIRGETRIVWASGASVAAHRHARTQPVSRGACARGLSGYTGRIYKPPVEESGGHRFRQCAQHSAYAGH